MERAQEKMNVLQVDCVYHLSLQSVSPAVLESAAETMTMAVVERANAEMASSASTDFAPVKSKCVLPCMTITQTRGLRRRRLASLIAIPRQLGKLVLC